MLGAGLTRHGLVWRLELPIGVVASHTRSDDMALTASQLNPFMLLLNPEVVLAAIEKSERLGQLNRQLCRPLDRVPGIPSDGAMAADDADIDLESTEAELDPSAAQ